MKILLILATFCVFFYVCLRITMRYLPSRPFGPLLLTGASTILVGGVLSHYRGFSGVWGFELALFLTIWSLILTDLYAFQLPTSLILIFCFLSMLLKGFSFFELTIYGIFTILLVTFCLKKLMEMLGRQSAWGNGDTKLLLASAFWVPVGELPLFLLFVGLLGSSWGLGWRFVTRRALFPLGPVILLLLVVWIVKERFD
jgi:prepilin signal peptidase PulO-like enzyme (type II secretory pathway)